MKVLQGIRYADGDEESLRAQAKDASLILWQTFNVPFHCPTAYAFHNEKWIAGRPLSERFTMVVVDIGINAHQVVMAELRAAFSFPFEAVRDIIEGFFLDVRGIGTEKLHSECLIVGDPCRPTHHADGTVSKFAMQDVGMTIVGELLSFP